MKCDFGLIQRIGTERPFRFSDIPDPSIMKKNLGRQGETIAASYLSSKGYEILHTNWYFEKKELDIIARDQDVLVFVEVKTRINEVFEKPDDLISNRKIRFIVEAADAYIKQFNLDLKARFDVIIVILGAGKPVIEHFERAFVSFGS